MTQTIQTFDEDTVRKFENSRPDIVGKLSRFRRDSLTATKHPYKRLSSRRDVPESIPERAEFALSCLVLQDQGSRPRIVLCRATPQWVSDLVNRSTGPSGRIGHWRQRFVHESLKMIKATSPPSVATADDIDQLRSWEKQKRKRSYVQSARKLLNDYTEKQLLRLAQKIERWEVYMQVYDGLASETYDGRLYSKWHLQNSHKTLRNMAVEA